MMRRLCVCSLVLVLVTVHGSQLEPVVVAAAPSSVCTTCAGCRRFVVANMSELATAPAGFDPAHPSVGSLTDGSEFQGKHIPAGWDARTKNSDVKAMWTSLWHSVFQTFTQDDMAPHSNSGYDVFDHPYKNKTGPGKYEQIVADFGTCRLLMGGSNEKWKSHGFPDQYFKNGTGKQGGPCWGKVNPLYDNHKEDAYSETGHTSEVRYGQKDKTGKLNWICSGSLPRLTKELENGAKPYYVYNVKGVSTNEPALNCTMEAAITITNCHGCCCSNLMSFETNVQDTSGNPKCGYWYIKATSFIMAYFNTVYRLPTTLTIQGRCQGENAHRLSKCGNQTRLKEL